MATKTLRVETVAQAYLELLRDRGVDCFFANAGTDFASIVDAFARFAMEGKTAPRPIAVPHEFVAVSMAHGYYLVTGRPQAVKVHVTVGTANGRGAVITASRTQVPVLLTAGRTPITEEGGDVRLKGDVKLNTIASQPPDTYMLVSNNPGLPHQGGTCFGDSGGPTFDDTNSNLVLGVTSFGFSSTCSGVGGVYRLDQPDDIAFLAEFGIAP